MEVSAVFLDIYSVILTEQKNRDQEAYYYKVRMNFLK